MLEKQIEITEYIHHADGNVSLKKAINILENGTVIASIFRRDIVTDVDANPDIPEEIKPHIKAISEHHKSKENTSKKDAHGSHQ
jgi:hypothetical protein